MSHRPCNNAEDIARCPAAGAGLTEQAMRRFFTEILTAAGYNGVELAAVPNGGCPCATQFRFRTHMGEISIGWRERAIHIDWSDTRQDLHLLFCSEDAAKGAYFIRASGKEKAIDYLMRVWLAFFRRDPPR